VTTTGSLPAAGPAERPRTFIIAALGITQTVGYGSLYYAFTVLAPAMTASFGWAPEWTYGGFSAGLLAGGLAAPWTGRFVDRYGARPVMAAGSVLAAAALLFLASASSAAAYFAAMIVVEIVSTMVFYDAAFAALAQAKGPAARRSISKLTLIAGFASTIFWPLTTALLTVLDWRDIYRIYALAQIVVCLPLHFFALPTGRRHHMAEGGSGGKPAAPATRHPPYLEGGARRRAFVLLALAFSLQGFVVSAMAVHMLTLLQGFGLTAIVAVGVGAMVGPSQVAGRLVEMLFGTDIRPTTTAWVSAALMPLGFLLLMTGAAAPAVAGLFAIAYGISMGLSSIVRGTVPLALFGPIGYGAMLGRLSAPGLVVKAAAPLLFATVIERAGLTTGVASLLVLSALAALALAALARSG